MGFEGQIKEYPGALPEKGNYRFPVENVRRALQSIERKKLTSGQKSAWSRKKNIYSGLFGALAILATEAGNLPEREWEGATTHHELSQKTVDIETIRFKLRQELLEKFQINDVSFSHEDCAPEDYADIFSRLNPKLQVKILSNLQDIEIRPAKAGERETIRELNRMEFTDKNWAKQLPAAVANSVSGRIKIFTESVKMYPQSFEEYVFLHELGHLIDKRLVWDSSRLDSKVDWRDVTRNAGREVSDYPASLKEGEEKSLEDFAETFAKLAISRRVLAEEDPVRFAAMNKYIADITGEEYDES